MKQLIPFQFGISTANLSPFDGNVTKARRLEKLINLKESNLILKVCKHYINNFVPLPVENENKYWIISCYPSTDNSPVRVSIWFPEVFNIHEPGHYYNYSNELYCMVFLHTDYLDKSIEKEALKAVKGLSFQSGYRFVTGIQKQMAAFMPLKSYFDFVENEAIYEGIRVHNYELTLKGKTPFKKGHNYVFFRYLVEHRF